MRIFCFICLLAVHGCNFLVHPEMTDAKSYLLRGQLNQEDVAEEGGIPFRTFLITTKGDDEYLELQIDANGFKPFIALCDLDWEPIKRKIGKGLFLVELDKRRQFGLLLASLTRDFGTYTIRATAIRELSRKPIRPSRSASANFSPAEWSRLKKSSSRMLYKALRSRDKSLEQEGVIYGTLSASNSHKLDKENKLFEQFVFDIDDTSEYIEVNFSSKDFDPWLMLISPSGQTWTDDDSGEGRNSRLIVKPDKSGSWLLVATSYSKGEEGEFELSVERVTERHRPIRLVRERAGPEVVQRLLHFLRLESWRQESRTQRRKLEYLRRKLARLRPMLRERQSRKHLYRERLSRDNSMESERYLRDDLGDRGFRTLFRYIEERERLSEERLDFLMDRIEEQGRLLQEQSIELKRLENRLRIGVSQAAVSGEAANLPMPEFPWPPPQASALYVLPRNLIVAEGGLNRLILKHVDSRLTKALAKCGYHEKRYYAVPDGFALVTRLEQIDERGRPKEPRWSTEIGRPFHTFSLSTYLKALLLAPEGHYRVLVFVVTTCPFATLGKRPTEQETKEWLSGGLNVLPSFLSNRAFTKQHRATMLIYEFEKRGHEGELDFLVPGKFQGDVHLMGSGISAALREE